MYQIIYGMSVCMSVVLQLFEMSRGLWSKSACNELIFRFSLRKKLKNRAQIPVAKRSLFRTLVLGF